jgi:hypothetical protein
MKITTWSKTTEIEVPDGHGFDLCKFAAVLLIAGISLQASADRSADLGFGTRVKDAFTASALPLDLQAGEEHESNGRIRNDSGETLAAYLQAQGVEFVATKGDDGLIDSIHAKLTREQDVEELEAVLESLHATAPAPAQLVGDLAQASVGLTGSETQVLNLSEWTIDWKRKTADATTTDNSTYESSLGSTASWTVKAKFIFLDSDPTQANNILATISSPQTAVMWNFFPTIAQGRASFRGMAYVDGITIASGMGKVVSLDVSLKGTGPLYIATQLAPTTNANTVTGEQAQN